MSTMRPLDPHQQEALTFIKDRAGCAGLFMAPGTGKTLTVIRYGMWLSWKAKERITALIFCRSDDVLTWQCELKEEGQQCEVWSPSKCMSDEVHMSDKSVWVIVTYDSVHDPEVCRSINGTIWDLCACDEAHNIKRWEAKRTQRVIKLTRKIPRRIAMTGTPLTNNAVLDVFSQCLFIDNGKLFGTNQWQFKKAYFLKSGPGWYPRRESAEKVKEKLKTLAMYVHEDDVLKLPTRRNAVKIVRMSGMQRRYFNQVLNEWELELNDGKLFEFNQTIVQLSKLKQISSGFYYQPDGSAVRLRCPKLDMLCSMFDKDGVCHDRRKVVVWCSMTDEIHRIAEELERFGKCVKFCGGDRQKKNEARQAFKTDPKIRFFIGQVDSGVGMNELIVANTAIYFSNSFKVVSRLQSERRIRRRGSEYHKFIEYWDLITEGSTDAYIKSCVGRSINAAAYILTALQNGMKLRSVVTGRTT